MGLVTDGIHGIKASRMAVRIPETIEDTAVPLFTIEDGVASSSAGIACARMAGVKEAVIVRAHEVVAAVKNRRKVHPLMEILRKELDLSSAAKNTVLEFIDTNWARASDSDINQFVSRVDQTLDINS
jgi:DNA mismatch repair protein MSH5